MVAERAAPPRWRACPCRTRWGRRREHRDRRRLRRCADAEQRLEVVGEGLARRSAGRGCAPAAPAPPATPLKAASEKHIAIAVVVVGVDRRRRASAAGGVTSMKSAPSTTRGAELAQLGRHRRDAVGLLDAPAGDVGQRASCRRRTAPSRPASSPRRGCGCSRASIGCERPSAAPHLEPARRRCRSARPSPAPRRRSGCRPGSSRCRRLRCAAARRSRAIAPSAMKYDADDASPSTWMSPGER